MFRDTLRCEVYVRDDTYGTFDAQQSVLERIRRLDDEGVFDAAGVESTWDRVSIREDEVRDDALATYEEFRDWAAANDFSLEPAFDTRPRYVRGTTERTEAVVFPVVAMAIYRDDELRAVLPSSDEFDHYTVHEALEGFEREDIERWLSRFTGVTVERSGPRIAGTTEL